MRTTQVTISPVTLNPGLRGPFVSPTLPADAAQFIVTMQMLTWPASGDVMVLTLEESNDNGATWVFSASETLSGGVFFDKQHNQITQEVWTTSFLFLTGQRKIRLSVDVLQQCRISGTIDVR